MLVSADLRSNSGRFQCAVGTGTAGARVRELLQSVFWGEPQSALFAHFGKRASVLQRPMYFGDTYTQIVLRDVVLGGVPLIAFFQIDKVTVGLKRIQLSGSDMASIRRLFAEW